MNIDIDYVKKGDYFYPALTMEVPDGDIGKYGRMRLSYLQEHREELHCGLLLSGSLKKHLLTINAQAQIQIDALIAEMLQARPAPDKQSDQLGWVHHMNMIISAAEEIVSKELGYVDTKFKMC